MKLKDIKGLLPKKSKIPTGNFEDVVYDGDQSYPTKEYYDTVSGNARNSIIDLLAEREIEVSVCQVCGADKHYKKYCSGCMGNGVIIKVKESR